MNVRMTFSSDCSLARCSSSRCRTRADEQTADFQIALEAARLTDSDYLAAMQALGEAEADEDEVAAIEEALRGRVRTSLGLPRLRVAGQLNIVEYARAHGINPSFELTMRPDDPAAHLADDKIRALYVKNRLETRLRGIHDKYRAHASESGIHTLYIAFGFIEWPEEAGAAASHHAPLLLMPYISAENWCVTVISIGFRARGRILASTSRCGN